MCVCVCGTGLVFLEFDRVTSSVSLYMVSRRETNFKSAKEIKINGFACLAL